MKCIYKFILFRACLLIFSTTAFSQVEVTYNVKSYTVFDGLSNNWVSDIYQDKDGFMWFATQYGLNRFDGKRFKAFTYVPGDSTALRANWIRCIRQIKGDHKLYLGSLGGGINILDPYQEKFTPLFPESDTHTYTISHINNLVVDPKENIWISSTAGTFRYNAKEGIVKRIYDRGTSNISISENGSQYMLTQISKEVFGVHGDTALKQNLPDDAYKNIYTISKDSLLLYTKKDLLIAYRSNKLWKIKKLGFESEYATSVRERPFIFKDNNGYIWVNGGDKIYKFSPDFNHSVVMPLQELLNFRSSKKVKANCMFQDKEDNFWIGTNLGVFQLIPHKPLRHPFLGALGKVRKVVECGDKIWFALQDGIYSWDKDPINSPKKVTGSTVNTMICASDEFLYALGRDDKDQTALLKINSNDQKITPIYFPELEFPISVSWKITEDKSRRLWIGQWDNIIVYDLKSEDYFGIPVFKENTGIIELYNDNQDNIWLGSIGKGVLKFSKASSITEDSKYQFEQYLYDVTNPQSISSNLIQSIHQDQRGLLWIGTDGGLNRFNSKTKEFERFLRSDKMPNDKILNIISDDNGIIWLSTVSHGITSYDPDKGVYKTYSIQDGLYDNSMVLSSVYQDKEGYIWMGSERGIQYFDPNKLTFSVGEKPNLAWISFTKFRSDTTIVSKFPEKSGLKQNQIKIYPKDQSISFDFQALTFERSQNIRYQFWLQGFHKEWLPIQSDGIITLSYLPKGKYKLQIKAFDIDNSWEINDEVDLVVLPPWYKTNLAYLLYGSLLFLIAFAFYKIRLRRKIAETEKEFVKDLSQSKTRWFNQIAHEFRTPLTVILGATDQIRDKLGNTSEDKTDKHLSQIENQTNHLSNQVQKILEIAQMKDNQLEIHLSNGDFIAFQKYLFNSFTSLAQRKDVTLEFISSEKSMYASFDEDKWRKISTNLISNAIKYNRERGTVSLRLDIDREHKKITLEIKDTGVGISKQFLSKLFDPFSKENPEAPQGVGLGLTLTKELIHLLGGTIKVDSKKAKGTSFTIIAPLDILSTDDDSIKQTNEFISDPDKALVLIAEDSKEVREYIHFCLSTDFTIIEAENGRIAWELCKKHIPDLVISDVMMPEWDGIRLGSEIRNNLVTNHIPFILLTAKSGQSNQLEGLKIGADAYVTKPFDRNELLIRVDNLINTRKKLQEKYQRGDITVTPENKTIDHFMKEVIQIIQQELDNDNFGVPQLAEKLHISRVHLFRKIKNLTGLPPTKFIRKIRLQKAHEFVLQNDLSISEIAYQTGFKDPAYFTRVYVEEFGKPPSEFRNR
ncbi:hybrid sensor histidine kinase/response regulator transcription factor [Aquimarina litoralis]|uniref:hybrid sensor histidine kinase/response regulator transcription factor n=1 Tax=Aquimarina litoralis TaxID=584605 RepID=UPI001C5900ED|nr:two-component regulator propeller domain-containing protein [Aquimarina litoralis]MBW1298873.1 response regulator [Aquimarina litoralis]